MTKIASAKPKAIASAVGLGLTLATLTANKAYADPVDFETECVNPDKGCISPPDEYAKNGQQLEVRWQGAKVLTWTTTQLAGGTHPPVSVPKSRLCQPIGPC